MLDLLGKDTIELKKKKLFLFDMDGTIYEGNRLFDGTIELLKYIDSIQGKYIFITNNSSKSVKDYITKVSSMNILVSKDNFFTSSQATALYLNEKYYGKKVFCLGTVSFIKELNSLGINAVDDDKKNIDAVVVGFDTELTYDKLCDTCELVSLGLPFIATNMDRACPTSFGFIPDCGAICETIYFATNRRPKFIGKPDPLMVELVMEKFGYSKEQTVVIGDRLYTDIATGVNTGVSSICVLTGEAKLADCNDGEVKPEFVFPSVKELWEAIK